MKSKSISEKPTPILTVNKWKFITWLFIISIVMLFASQTSAYLVRRAEGNWIEFTIPTIFYTSTVVLLFSSLFLELSLRMAKKDEFRNLKIFISIAFSLGIVFLILQYFGWQDLQRQGVYLKGNPSGSFFYILTGLHGIHLISGLFVILAAFLAAFKTKIHSKKLVQLQVCSTYWHFLDLLWVYLLVFLIYFR
ncbi:MAG: heme-copper oxidase subunit III [Spirosomataceae bacterium]